MHLLWHQHAHLEPPQHICLCQARKHATCVCFLKYELFSSHLGLCLVTDRQTDRQKAMHKSPPCISTGVLKNGTFRISTQHPIPLFLSWQSFPHFISHPSEFWKCLVSVIYCSFVLLYVHLQLTGSWWQTGAETGTIPDLQAFDC